MGCKHCPEREFEGAAEGPELNENDPAGTQMTPALKAVITTPIFQMKRRRLGVVQSHGRDACGGRVSWVRSLPWEEEDGLEMGGGDGGTAVWMS